jgi:hypothetical protein
MADSQDNTPDARMRRRGAVSLSELVGKVLAPVTAKRGIARTDLIAAWPDIVGPRFADCSRPDKIVWPKGPDADGKPGMLILRVHGPRAIYVQHEAGQILERVNAFLGYAAISQIKIVQGPVTGPAKVQRKQLPTLPAAAETRLATAVADISNDGLRAALQKLGRGILSEAGGNSPVNRKVTGESGKSP